MYLFTSWLVTVSQLVIDQPLDKHVSMTWPDGYRHCTNITFSLLVRVLHYICVHHFAICSFEEGGLVPLQCRTERCRFVYNLLGYTVEWHRRIIFINNHHFNIFNSIVLNFSGVLCEHTIEITLKPFTKYYVLYIFLAYIVQQQWRKSCQKYICFDFLRLCKLVV